MNSISKQWDVVLGIIWILLLIIPNSADAAQRMVIGELATNTGCVYCFFSENELERLYPLYSDSLSIIRYHSSGPDNQDPFYRFNPVQNTARINYYELTGVPRFWVDGTYSHYFTDYEDSILSRMPVESPFEITLSGSFNDETKSGFINVVIYAESDLQDIPEHPLKLRAALVESDLFYNAPNYHFWHDQVFRLMYPSTEGEPFTLDEEESKFSSFDFDFDEYDFDFEECDFVAFVQDDSTKEIMQGARINLLDLDENPRFGVHVEPNDGNIIIPGEGGSFVYTGIIRNYAAKPETSQVWIKLRFPDGSETQIMNEYDIPLQPLHSFIDSTIVQYIPAHAPEGRYKYKVYVGHYPTVYDSSFFYFEKVPQIQSNKYISSYRTVGWCASCNQRLSVDKDDNASEFICSPNPFNPTAGMSFILDRAQHVNLEIYNILGKRMEILRDEHLGSGQHRINWDGSKYPSGVYFARLATEEGVRTIKLTLLR